MEIPEERRKYIFSFHREHTLTIVSALPSAEDTIPPSKIGDFNVAKDRDSKLKATWTAVGGNFLDGQTDIYRIYYSTDIMALVAGTATDYVEFTKYDMVGTASNASFELPSDGGRSLYVGIRAGDLADNFGRISNLVEVELEDPALPPNQPTQQPTLPG